MYGYSQDKEGVESARLPRAALGRFGMSRLRLRRAPRLSATELPSANQHWKSSRCLSGLTSNALPCPPAQSYVTPFLDSGVLEPPRYPVL